MLSRHLRALESTRLQIPRFINYYGILGRPVVNSNGLSLGSYTSASTDHAASPIARPSTGRRAPLLSTTFSNLGLRFHFMKSGKAKPGDMRGITH